MDNQNDGADQLFDVGDPVTLILAPELPPEPPRVVELDRTQVMQFSPPVSGAAISPCGKYRYILWRKFKSAGKKICWICLNPSKADAVLDDPTLNRITSFSKREGAAEVFVCNLFAYRATNPKDMRAFAEGEFGSGRSDVFGPDNDESIRSTIRRCDTCVVGWGNGGGFRRAGRKLWVKLIQIEEIRHIPLLCLGKTKSGHPLHPLYVASNKPLTPFQYGDINDDDCEL